jgi:hypothetical protein
MSNHINITASFFTCIMPCLSPDTRLKCAIPLAFCAIGLIATGIIGPHIIGKIVSSQACGFLCVPSPTDPVSDSTPSFNDFVLNSNPKWHPLEYRSFYVCFIYTLWYWIDIL